MSAQLIHWFNDPSVTLESVGGKGASLSRLVDADFPVPEGFHISTEAYRRFVNENKLQPRIDTILKQIDSSKPATLEDAARQIHEAFISATIPGDIASAIVGAYSDLKGMDPAVAVRSSATAEDLPEASFAGQQDTFLNVSGADQVLEATLKCWSSLWTARAIGYRAQQGIDSSGVALAVVVQRLVPAEIAGILFTANPMNGRRDQVVISAAWGLGDAVVGGRVTPDSYTTDKGSGKLVQREVADKEIMTVRVDGDTEDEPVPDNLRKVPVLEEQDLTELTRLGVEIEKLYELPMDIEWALADGEFSILQARPITALPEVSETRAEDWPLPKPKGRYLRTSVVDYMPNPLSPLFATMGLSAYNDGMRGMLTYFTGIKADKFPEEMLVTINGYAYYLASYSGGEWWALLSGLGPRIPKLIRQGPTHFREVALPEYKQQVAALEAPAVTDMTAVDIWRDAHELILAAIYHLSILQVDTLGAAAGSEGLFTALYNRFYRSEGDPEASAFLMGFDTEPIRSEKSLYDLAIWAREQAGLNTYLLEAQANEIASALKQVDPPAGVRMEAWAELQRRVETHQRSFGYILYDLDFVVPVPAEDLTPAFEVLKIYLRGEGVDPHDRQGRLEDDRVRYTNELRERARGLRGWAVKKALGWAQSMGEVREDSIASIGVAYPRLRKLLLELGRRLVEAGAIEEPKDIFWLQESEVESTLKSLQDGDSIAFMQDQIKERKATSKAHQKLMPPTQLPFSKTYMGIPIEVFVPGEGGQEGDTLKGVGASSGTVTGVAYVLHGPEDFDQMEQGGILVAKITTPAWTPLFAMAGGVVTDIGGPLSHGSIVAREYGIPAVLGTVAATRVIQNGQQITVDGDAGLVRISPIAPS
ncbi:MAG: hypothetical protein GTO18_19005 [Anaerolineales bacterium]|nr:hypothetical protein [Anaerolineales bacterium]